MGLAGLESVKDDGKPSAYNMEGVGQLHVFLCALVDFDRGINDTDDGGDGANHFQPGHLEVGVNELSDACLQLRTERPMYNLACRQPLCSDLRAAGQQARATMVRLR